MIASMLAILGKETRELLRVPYMLGISFLMPIILLMLFGYGLNLDVDHIPTAVVDQDASPQSVATSNASRTRAISTSSRLYVALTKRSGS